MCHETILVIRINIVNLSFDDYFSSDMHPFHKPTRSSLSVSVVDNCRVLQDVSGFLNSIPTLSMAQLTSLSSSYHSWLTKLGTC